MGMIFSRQNARIEELDITSNNAYRYPNKEGNYFASHFIMGGERFETSQPEAYLFGENIDLNFLGGKPTPFPYPAPQPNEPTRTLKSLINIRKESLRFIKVPDTVEVERSDNASLNTSYNIEFTFDSDVRCGITIYYFCTEEIMANGVIYTPQDASMNSETSHYKKGVNQQFTQVSHVFDPSKYSEDMLNYKFEDEIIPVLIQCVAEEGEEPRQSHMVFAVVEKNIDGTYILKPLKQKLFVDGLCYLLQEIYGIENKNVYQSKDVMDEDVEDSGSECVICMSDARDTLILPCRHLCLCNSCADSLRYQANNCPICRAPFRALLQIKAVRKYNNALSQINHNAENQPTQDIPHGYEPVSLIEALNGPTQPSAPLIPSYMPAPIPSFGNSPDIRRKHRYLDRNHSSSASKLGDSSIAGDATSIKKLPENSDCSFVPEVLEASMIDFDKRNLKTDSLSLTRGEVRRHRKGCRTSSAPEKIRLLANSVEIVSELGVEKRNKENEIELAETRSLLENNAVIEKAPVAVIEKTSEKPSRPCSRSSPISLSTPHSLHLCEKSSKDSSPCGEDSDYYTPEDPNTTILVDQGTDTSLDTPQSIELGKLNNSKEKGKCSSSWNVNHKIDLEKFPNTVEESKTESICLHDMQSSIPMKQSESITPDSFTSYNPHSVVVKLETTDTLTPASSTNKQICDNSTSSSNSHIFLQPQSYDALLE